MKSKSIIGLFLLIYVNATGQVLDYFRDIQSPQVALMNHYGDYPVDFSTGLVNISIPLYTIQTTSLSVPLQLKFHASGLRADEREGLFGIRWALFGGGQVTRQIKGYPDERYPFNANANNPDRTPDFYDLYGTTSGMIQNAGLDGNYNEEFLSGFYSPYNTSIYYQPGSYQDTEYDIFSYTLPSGKSGKFIVQGTTGIPMPYEPIQISVNKTIGTPISSMSITDENGDIYRFGGIYKDVNDNQWPTTWHLSTMISANKQDTILFTYTKPNITTYNWNSTLTVSDNLHDNTSFETYLSDPYFTASALYLMLGDLLTISYNYFKQNNYANASVAYSPYSVSSISFNEGGNIGRIDFSYLKDNYGWPTYLSQMIVRNAQNNAVKTIEFDLKSNLSGNLKLLDMIKVFDNLNTNYYTYKFDYYDSQTVPTCGNLSANSDWWGYYSDGGGGLKNQTLSVATPLNGSVSMQVQGGSKSSNETSMKIGMLKSITYPTGGQTEFDYEGNRYAWGLCGGLRISNVRNISASGKTEFKHYEYGESLMPGYLYAPSCNPYTENEIVCYINTNSGNGIGTGSYLQRIYQGAFPSRYSDFQSNTVYYNTVSEYLNNATGDNNNGMTQYVYSINLPDFSYFNNLAGGNFEGYLTSTTGYQHGYVSPADFWRITELASKTFYQGSHKIKEYQYEYQPYRIKSIYDLPVFKYRTYRYSTDSNENVDKLEIMTIYPYQLSQTFAFKHQQYTIGADKLTKETENIFYDDGSHSSIIKEYTYDSNYLFPLTETITNSNGDAIKTEKKYPFNTSGWVYTDMSSKNILTQITQINKYKNNSTLESTTFNYKPYPNTTESTSKSSYRPESIVQTDRNGNTFSLVDFMQFDSKGNPIYMSKNGSVKVVYIWSYGNQNRIAKVEGLTYDQVINIIGQDLINSLAAAINPTRDQIEQIRSKIGSSGLPAFITTYSYSPLVGVTTITNPQGITTTYTYDSFNQLQDIKNDDSNILNNFRYHYYTQQ